jgi:NAD(P)-dependent dehydrogenase (short-subunit alcohol dehydrogenase family)
MSTQTRPLTVVTGVSSGVGRSVARQFAEHGFDLVVTAAEPASGRTSGSPGRP